MVEDGDHAVPNQFIRALIVGGIAVLPSMSVEPAIVALGLFLVDTLVD